MYTKSLGLTLTLAIALITLGYVNPAFGNKPDAVGEHNHGSDEGGSQSENLSSTFCLTIELTGTNQYILWDGIGEGTEEYCADRKEKVAVGTGSGDGFRWDTNLQNTNKTQHFMLRRWVYMNVDGDPLHRDSTPQGHPSDEFEIDFRFNQTTGLDLGSLDENDGFGYVAATLLYYAGKDVLGHDFENYGILGFGALNAPFPTDATDPVGAACLGATEKIKVTRTSATEWMLESPENNKACRFPKDANGDRCIDDVDNGNPPVCATVIDFQFKFIITQQD